MTYFEKSTVYGLQTTVKSLRFTFNSQKSTVDRLRSTVVRSLFANSNGFSLIELLIVIAVISIIMVVLVPNFVGVRERARDTQRKSDLSTIQKALELYKLDTSPAPAYPTSGALGSSTCGQCWSSGAGCTGNIYLRRVPCDPGSTGPTPYFYNPGGGNALTYTLTACLENYVDTDRDSTVYPGCGASGASYSIHEP